MYCAGSVRGQDEAEPVLIFWLSEQQTRAPVIRSNDNRDI